MLFEFSYAESLQCRLIIDIFTHGLDLDPFSILQVNGLEKGLLEKGALGKGCFGKKERKN